MEHIEKTIEIKAPVERVWELMSNPERIPEWAKGYVEKVVINGFTDAGVATREIGVAFGKPYEKTFEVTEIVEKERISFKSTSGWPWKGSWIMKPTEEGTLFTYVVDFEIPFRVEKLRASFKQKYEELIEKWVRNIKKIVEKP